MTYYDTFMCCPLHGSAHDERYCQAARTAYTARHPDVRTEIVSERDYERYLRQFQGDA